ncbi:MAG: hypothetical protein QNK03_03850 [Myxococcota bacterium]|nr:hypothetical protein [Myxococcota bacterium]
MKRLLSSVIALVVCLGCIETVQVRKHPSIEARGLVVSRVAVGPFRLHRPGLRVREDAPQLVALYVADALRGRGLEVVPPSDVSTALRSDGGPVDPREAAAVVQHRFGAQALVLGTITRFREREGRAAGAMTPASVGFQVRVYGVPDGLMLWSGAFDETQQSLGSNVFNARRYPGGGMRWLSAEEMARWGAGEIAEALPVPR